MRNLVLTSAVSLAWMACAVCSSVLAVDAGVTDSEIKLGASVVLTGPLAPGTVSYGQGATLLFDEVNRKGGINRRLISVTRMDDGFDVARATENTKKLINEDRVFLLFNSTGTAHTAAILPLAVASKTVVFGPVTGATVFREKFEKYLFNVRASYADEAKQMTAQLKLTGVQRVAIFAQEDTLGKTLSGELVKAVQAEGLQLVAQATTDPKKPDFAAAAAATMKGRPEAVLMASSGSTFTGFVKALQATPTVDVKARVYGFSIVSPDSLTRDIGAAARGIVLAQIFPSLRNRREEVVNEYHQLLAKKDPAAKPSASQLEGFIHAKLLVEGLTRAGRNLNAETFISAMESMRAVQYGKFIARYSATAHLGSSYVELAIVDSDLLLRY